MPLLRSLAGYWDARGYKHGAPPELGGVVQFVTDGFNRTLLGLAAIICVGHRTAAKRQWIPHVRLQALCSSRLCGYYLGQLRRRAPE